MYDLYFVVFWSLFPLMGRVFSLTPNHGNSITSWISTSNVVDPSSSSCLEGKDLGRSGDGTVVGPW